MLETRHIALQKYKQSRLVGEVSIGLRDDDTEPRNQKDRTGTQNILAGVLIMLNAKNKPVLKDTEWFPGFRKPLS